MTAKVRLVRKFCVREIEKQAERDGTRAAQAALEIAERWRKKGQRPMTDAEGEQVRKKQLWHLKPKIKTRMDTVTKSEWKQLRFCVDSGAGETVMAEEELPEVDTQASWAVNTDRAAKSPTATRLITKGRRNLLHI